MGLGRVESDEVGGDGGEDSKRVQGDVEGRVTWVVSYVVKEEFFIAPNKMESGSKQGKMVK